MKNGINNSKNLVQRLLSGKLSSTEKEELNKQPFIDRMLKSQWEETPEQIADYVKEQRILDKITHQIHQRPKRRSFLQQPMQIAVALIGIALIGSIIFLVNKPSKPDIWYVQSLGYQCMDSLVLADGSKVILNAGSKLIYPEDFNTDKREVTLSGQAFFYIKPDAKRPFTVKTKNMDVTALGTAFEVFSFDGDEKSETILLNGKTLVETKNQQGLIQNKYILNPNEKLSYNKETEAKIEQINADSYSAWRSGGKLKFTNERLIMIIPRLEKWYGQKIVCPSEIAKHYRFTFSIKNESLEQILSNMSQSSSLTYQLINDSYYTIENKK